MQKEINMLMADGEAKPVAFQANGGTAIRFRMVFQRELMDCIRDILDSLGEDKLGPLIRAAEAAEAGAQGSAGLEDNPQMLRLVLDIAGSGQLDVVSKLAYIMHAAAIRADMRALNLDDYLDWLETFDSMEFMTHAAEILMLYLGSRQGTSDVKKKQDRLTVL